MQSEKPDFFLEKFGVGRLHQIQTCFEKCGFEPGQSFHFRVSRIYDPSKFWIVVKFRELELYEKYLFRCYYLNRNEYKIPQDKIEVDMYCVVFIDSAYHRALIVGAPRDLQPTQEVQIYFLDYGTIQTVEVGCLYYMTKTQAEVPQFVVRASLAGLCPKTTHQWTNEDFKAFSDLVTGKILTGVIVNVDSAKQVLEIRCSFEDTAVDDTLIAQKRARFFHEKAEIGSTPTLLEPKLKYQYLFPTHEALESGKLPLTIIDMEYLMHVSPYSPVVLRYYKEKNPGE